MRTNLFKKAAQGLLIALFALWSSDSMAKKDVTDKDLQGVWVMESYCYPNNAPHICGINDTQVKVYGADGEYACALIYKTKEGIFQVIPHEYGTYTFKDGVYSEMGREKTLDGVVLTDKNTFKGRWGTRQDIWKKVNNMPQELVNYILMVCKAKQAPTDNIQQMIKKYMFK